MSAANRRIISPTLSRMTTTTLTDEQLIARIRETAVLHGDFTLRSGRKSKYYLDKYLFISQPDILTTLGEKLAACVTPEVTHIAGPELGGVPLASATSMASGLPMVLIRNAKKDYGTAKQFEGKLEAGDTVLITEDIATTGGQSIEAATMLRDMGVNVAKIVVVIDRQEGARENIEDAGFAFEALITKSDLGINE